MMSFLTRRVETLLKSSEVGSAIEQTWSIEESQDQNLVLDFQVEVLETFKGVVSSRQRTPLGFLAHKKVPPPLRTAVSPQS